MSLPLGSVVTDVTLESLSASNQSNVPFTFGQVFKQGDMLLSESLAGRIGKDSQPLQYEVKATHNDGSVRHAIISGVLPSLAAKASTLMQLVKVADKKDVAINSTPCTASVIVTINNVVYNATIDNTHLANTTWLAGSVVQEKHFNLPFTGMDGKEHPHLFARFAVRDYGSNSRLDLTVENNWAYAPAPQNFTYDVEVLFDGTSVYKKPNLTHYHHARWRRLFWKTSSPAINVRLNVPYLISTKAVPNYEQSSGVAESFLETFVPSATVEPMGIGLAASYMPMTGAHNDIGILPLWTAAYILSMDNRARNGTLATGNGAGSWSMHYRDRITDRPVSLVNYPHMTLDGNYGDTWNSVTNKMEAFPGVAAGNDSPYTADTAHQPSLAYVPYLVTGDYFYLEEMQFWSIYNLLRANPNYRGFEKGLVISEQLRGQAWSLRTLAETAAFTPDADTLKAELNGYMRSNVEWFNSTYSNNAEANKLGIPIHNYSLAYNNGTAIAPWMDDFFTSAIGHAVDLGFEEAKPLLTWKAKFPVGRMVAQGVCWIDAAIYALQVRDSATSPVYESMAAAYLVTRGAEIMALPCAGPELAAKLGAKVGDMGQISDGVMGYPSNLQPALAYAVDAQVEGANRAWDLFMSRTVKPDYSLGPHFNIVPRNYIAAYVVPAFPPDSPPTTTHPITIPIPSEDGSWELLGTEGAVVTVPANTIVRYGVKGKWIYAKVGGSFTINNNFFGSDPAGGSSKNADKFIPTISPIEEPIMTFKVSVALSFANQTLPHGTEPQVTKTLVEILAADGATVVASSTDVYEFSGMNAGSYVVRASGIDSKGAVMGVPYTQAFTIVEEVVVPPVDNTPVEVSLPAGVTVSWVKE